MKVFILTEGSKDVGFGHITRCISLYQGFEAVGITPKLIVNGDDTIFDLLKGKKYRIFNWLKEKNKLLEMLTNVDIVIIDSYLADKLLYDSISEITNGPLLVIDDYNRIEYPKGIVVNPSIYGNELNYPKRDGQIYLLGKEYIILRKEFWSPVKKKINKEVRNILITFGGANHSDFIYSITDHIKNQFNFNVFVVQPKSDIYDAKGMINLMLDSDICISCGGQTTYELARLGVPTIGICFVENQKNNLKGWQKEDFIEYIGWYNNQDILDKLTASINKLSSHKERCRRHLAGKKLVDARGAERIVSIMVKEEKARRKNER